MTGSGTALDRGALHSTEDADRTRRAGRRLAFSVAAATAVATALALAVEAAQGGRSDDVGRPTSYSPRADGFRGLVEVCQRLGFRVARSRASFGKLPPPEQTVLVVLRPLPQRLLEWTGTRADEQQQRALRAWVAAGGRLVISVAGLSDLELAGVAIEEDAVRELIGDADANWVLRAFVDPPPEMGWALVDAQIAGAESLSGFEERWPELRGGARLLPEALHALATSAGEASVVMQRVFGEVPAGAQAVVTANGAPLVLELPCEAGTVWLVASSYPFSNLGLGRGGTGPLTAALLREASDGGERLLAFDEYGHGLLRKQGFLGWARHPMLATPLAGALLLVLLVGWRSAVRLGAPREPRGRSRRAKEEFVAGLADIKLRARSFRAAARSVLAAHAGRATADPEARAALAGLREEIERGSAFGEAELGRVVATADELVRDERRDEA